MQVNKNNLHSLLVIINLSQNMDEMDLQQWSMHYIFRYKLATP